MQPVQSMPTSLAIPCRRLLCACTSICTPNCRPESVTNFLVQVRTTMNMMGPLMNPAGAVYGLIGTYSPTISQLMGEALQRLGSKKALVVHSQGLDELTPLGEADIVDVTPQRIRRYSLDPKELGIPRSATKSQPLPVSGSPCKSRQGCVAHSW